ncbi:unnamed protein product, partial [Thelazia callipaeda]|uniref:SprT-like domain-containing protein n=1 Tax=Thelazia callipaeda TaxID=103827 RepID=A0A0N5D286_THECL
PFSVVDPIWETIDPNPDIQELFSYYNTIYFLGVLPGCEVKWSSRMTSSAGLFSYNGKQKCSIRLSQPLLQYRPRRDTVETLLHEMIHAYLFFTSENRNHNAHGHEFRSHMQRINERAGTNITIYHNFSDEVKYYRKHWWQCSGPCRERPPYYGWVKRSVNRAPGENDFWWREHQITCGGTFIKVKEPEGYKARKSTKRKNKKNQSVAGQNSLEHYFPGTGHVLGDLSSPTSSKNVAEVEQTLHVDDNGIISLSTYVSENAINRHLDLCIFVS